MAGTVTIAGHQVPKTLAFGGGALVVVAAIVYYRRKQASSSASSAAAAAGTSSTDTAAGIDPATGFPYGSPEDQAALASMGSGFGYPGGGLGGGSGGPLPTGGGGFTVNSQWAQAAETYMGSNGNDAIAAALGKYLTGQPVTQDQAQIIEEAIAAEGNPPVNGPNGMPPSFKTIPGGPGPGGNAHNPVSGLTATPGSTGIDLSWQASANATDYLVTAVGPGAGPAFKTGGATSTRVRNLRPHTHYDIRVRAQPGGTGGTDAHVQATTK
jgi:Fibronectin type III domain